MRQYIAIALLISSVLANTLPRWDYGLDGEIFCKWQAISFLFMSLAAAMNERGRVVNILWVWVVGLALNNAYDEILGDPHTMNATEVVFATIVTLWTIYRLIRCLKDRQKH